MAAAFLNTTTTSTSAPFQSGMHGTVGGGGAGQSGLMLMEELERTKKQLQQQTTECQSHRETIVKLQQRLVYAEHECAEAQTALSALTYAAQEDATYNANLVQQLQSQLDDVLSASAPNQSHAALMLQLEKAIPALLIEVVHHIVKRNDTPSGGATAKGDHPTGGCLDGTAATSDVQVGISPSVMESIRALQPVAALAQLRLWTRKLMELDQETLLASGTHSARKHRYPDTVARLVRAVSMRREKTGNDQQDAVGGATSGGGDGSLLKPTGSSVTLTTPAQLKSVGSRRSPLRRSSVASSEFDDDAVEMLRRRNIELEDEVATMRSYVTQSESELHRMQQAAQLAVFSARRDVGTLRLDLRQKQRQIEKLQGRTFLVDRVDLIAAQDEAAALKAKLNETAHNSAAALQAKSTECQVLALEKNEQIRALEARVQRMSKAQDHQRELREALRSAQRDAASAKQQLARANVKTLIEEKHKQQAVIKQHSDTADALRRDLEHTQTSLRSLQHTNQKMMDQYNALFEAKLAEARQRAKQSRHQEREAAVQAYCGPNSEMNAKYYRIRYQEVMVELKTAQKKLKHLIFLSHHDHLSFHLQRDDLSEQLRYTKSMLPKHVLHPDEDEDDREIIDTLRTTTTTTQRARSNSARDEARYGSPMSGSDGGHGRETRCAIEKTLQDDFSFSSYVAAAAAAKKQPTSSGKTSPALSRPSTAQTRRGYDVVSSAKAVHTQDVDVVGLSGGSESAGTFTNPRVSTLTAKVRTTRTEVHGGAGSSMAEVSQRMVVESPHRSATADLQSPTRVLSNGAVQEDSVVMHANDNSEQVVPDLYNPKSGKGVAYLRKSRRSEAVGSLSRPMTPVVRPASAML